MTLEIMHLHRLALERDDKTAGLDIRSPKTSKVNAKKDVDA